MAQIYGRAQVTVDGTLLRTVQGVQLDTGGVKNTSRPAANEINYSQELVPSKLQCKVQVAAGDSLDDFQNMIGVTINVDFDSGQSYVINGGWRTDTPVVTDGQGECTLNFEGPPAEEILS